MNTAIDKRLDRARKLWSRGSQPDALAALTEGVEAGETSVELLCQLAMWQFSLGHTDAWQRTLHTLGRLHKLDVEPLAADQTPHLAQLMDMSDPATAGTDPIARYFKLLGDLAAKASNAKAAGRYYLVAVQRVSRFLPACLGLAQSLLLLEKFGKCLELVDSWLEDHPRCVDLYRIGSQAAAGVGNAELANDYQHGWLSMDPSRSDLLATVGPWLFERGQIRACLHAYSAAFERSPDDADLMNVLAELHTHLARDDGAGRPRHVTEAIRLFYRSLAVNPEQPEVRQALERLKAGVLDDGSGTSRRPQPDSAELASPGSSGVYTPPRTPASSEGADLFADVDVAGFFKETEEVQEPDPYRK